MELFEPLGRYPSMGDELALEALGRKIHVLRGHRIMLDEDLAPLYGVTIKRLNQQVHRNLKRFPADFMFQLDAPERDSLRLQNATLESGRGRYRKWGAYSGVAPVTHHYYGPVRRDLKGRGVESC
ncbi:MAG: ORF6N domain-containing protein [Elusimicrobiota bacterium]